jgi:hypothetical protein
MRFIEEHFLDQSGRARRVLLSLGNGEVQRHLLSAGWTAAEIGERLRMDTLISGLLSDIAIQPTAHYYVPLTRNEVYTQIISSLSEGVMSTRFAEMAPGRTCIFCECWVSFPRYFRGVFENGEANERYKKRRFRTGTSSRQSRACIASLSS